MNPIIIDLPLPPDALHPNSRPTWQKRARLVKQARAIACIVARQNKPNTPLKVACYRLIFRLPRKRDYDGLGAWVKAYIDGFIDAGLLIDDSDFRPMGIERFSGVAESPFGVRFVIWEETT